MSSNALRVPCKRQCWMAEKLRIIVCIEDLTTEFTAEVSTLLKWVFWLWLCLCSVMVTGVSLHTITSHRCHWVCCLFQARCGKQTQWRIKVLAEEKGASHPLVYHIYQQHNVNGKTLSQSQGKGAIGIGPWPFGLRGSPQINHNIILLCVTMHLCGNCAQCMLYAYWTAEHINWCCNEYHQTNLFKI